MATRIDIGTAQRSPCDRSILEVQDAAHVHCRREYTLMATEPVELATEDPTKQMIIDLADVEGFTIADTAGDDEQGRFMIEMFGRDLLTKPIVQTSKLSVFHETAQPGDRVRPHRHGTHQLNYVLRGELIFG